jgi:putative tryptophan/tyrosine transport system substrate-binding protein
VRASTAVIETCVLAWSVLFLAIAHAEQEQPPLTHRIGVLSVPMEEFLRQGLRERGYTEGKNIIIEWRRAKQSGQELGSLAAELVQSKVDVIVTSGTLAARAALAATTTIPVVFSAGDPVGTGLAASLVKPGKNGTGVSVVSTELTAKRLDFLHQLAPRARRIAFLMNSSNPLGPLQLKEARNATSVLGVGLIILDSRNAAELDHTLHALQRNSVDAVLVTADLLFQLNKSKIARAVRQGKLPGMFPYREYLDDGMLASYGPDLKELASRMAVYVDKILKGAKPADLPIEQLSKYELIINLRVARELGIKVPQELLYRADEVMR